MLAYTRRGARRPDLQLYIPGRGLQGKVSKFETVTLVDKRSGLQSQQINSTCLDGPTDTDSSKPVKNRRPDIQIYVPKAQLYTSRVNGKSYSSLNDLPTREKANKEVEEISSHCSSQSSSAVKILNQHVEIGAYSVENGRQQVDSPILKSWADQVEEHLANEALVSQEVDKDSLDGNKSEKESNLMLDGDHENSVCSSGYSSSSNENLNFIEQETSKCNESQPSHCIQKQILQSSELGTFAQNKSDTFELVEARDKILDQQIAFFEKLVVKDKSTKPERKVSAPVQPREAPLFPGRESVEFLKMLAKREQIVEQQIAIFDKMLAKPKARKGEKAPVFQRLVIPSSAKPSIKDVSNQVLPHNVPCTKLEGTFRASDCLGSHPSPDSLSADLMIPPPLLPFNVPCAKLDNTFYASESLDFHHPVSLNADLYIPPPLPFNVPCAKLDHMFYAAESSDLRHPSVSLDAHFYIPPPRPMSKKV